MSTDPALEICRRLEALVSQIHVVRTPEDQDLLAITLIELRRTVMALVQEVDTTEVPLIVHSPEETIKLCIADLVEHGSPWKGHQLESLEQIGVAVEQLLFGVERIRNGESPDAVEGEGPRFSGIYPSKTKG